MTFTLKKSIKQQQLQLFNRLSQRLKQNFENLLANADFSNNIDSEPIIQVSLEEIYQLYQEIESWSTEKLNFQFPFSLLYGIPNIYHIRFQHIKVFNLNSSCLANVQFLAFLDMPYLQQLNLGYNYLVSLKPLVKKNFQYLKILNLDECQYIKTNQIKALSRVNVGQINLNRSDKRLPSLSAVQKLFPVNKSNLFSYHIIKEQGDWADQDHGKQDIHYTNDLNVILSMVKLKFRSEKLILEKLNTASMQYCSGPQKIRQLGTRRFGQISLSVQTQNDHDQ